MGSGWRYVCFFFSSAASSILLTFPSFIDSIQVRALRCLTMTQSRICPCCLTLPATGTFWGDWGSLYVSHLKCWLISRASRTSSCTCAPLRCHSRPRLVHSCLVLNSFLAYTEPLWTSDHFEPIGVFLCLQVEYGPFNPHLMITLLQLARLCTVKTLSHCLSWILWRLREWKCK